MLPLTTAKAGKIFVFSTSCAPNQKPETTSKIMPTIMTVCRYSFFRSFFMATVKIWLPCYEGMVLCGLGIFEVVASSLQKGKKKMGGSDV
jgi:hypothetical protein